MQEAVNDFKSRIQEISEQVGVTVKEIHIRKMKKKWASCSSKGRLTFDPSLLEEAPEKIIETVLHELLHLRYPNHGKMFQRMLPVYKEKYLNKIHG